MSNTTLEQAVKEICQACGNDRTRMMDIVRAVQARFGCVSDEAMDLIAREVRCPRVEVESVVTFYSFLAVKPQGKARHPPLQRHRRLDEGLRSRRGRNGEGANRDDPVDLGPRVKVVEDHHDEQRDQEDPEDRNLVVRCHHAGGSISARAKAVSASGPQSKAEAENVLTQALGRLFAVMENYPDLKSNQNVTQLQEELTSTENRIAFARQLYNDLVANYRTSLQVFPNNIVSSVFNFRPEEYFEAPAETRAVPAVDLSIRK